MSQGGHVETSRSKEESNQRLYFVSEADNAWKYSLPTSEPARRGKTYDSEDTDAHIENSWEAVGWDGTKEAGRAEDAGGGGGGGGRAAVRTG